MSEQQLNDLGVNFIRPQLATIQGCGQRGQCAERRIALGHGQDREDRIQPRDEWNSISRTGLAGFDSTNMTSLFSWQNTIASLGASAVMPGGRTKAGVDQAWAVYRQSLSQYQKTVLTAYQEVEDQLAALRILAGEAQSTADAVTTAQQAETIALNRYRNGLVSYLDVIYSQMAFLANQRTATQIVGQRMVATVLLIKAMAGGWLGVPAPQGATPNPTAPGRA